MKIEKRKEEDTRLLLLMIKNGALGSTEWSGVEWWHVLYIYIYIYIGKFNLWYGGTK